MPKEKVDYIRRGRELRRFLLEHAAEDMDLGFTQIDLAWMEKYSPPQESEEGEEMFPDKWVDKSGGVTQSFTSTRAHWRKVMIKLDNEQGTGVEGTVEAVVDEHLVEEVEPPVEGQSPPICSPLGAGLSAGRRAASELGEYQEDQGQQEEHFMVQQPATADGGRAVSVENAYRQVYTPTPIISPQPEHIVQTSWVRSSSRDQMFTGSEVPYSDGHQIWDRGYRRDSQHPQQANVPHGVEYPVTSNHPDNSQDWTPRRHAADDRCSNGGSYQASAPGPSFIPGSFPDNTAFKSPRSHRTQVSNACDEGSHRPFDEWRTSAYAGSGINDTRARPRQDLAQPYTRSHRGESIPLRPRITPERETQDNRSSVEPLPQPLSEQAAHAPNTEPRPMLYGGIPLVQWYVDNRRGSLPSVSVPTCHTTGAKPLYENVRAEIERRGLDVPTGDKASRSTKEKGKGRAVADREDRDVQGETRAGKSSGRHIRSHRRAQS